MTCGPEFCGTVPRSAGSLFLAGEGEKELFWASSPVRLSTGPRCGPRDDINVVQTLLGHWSPDFQDDYLRARDR